VRTLLSDGSSTVACLQSRCLAMVFLWLPYSSCEASCDIFFLRYVYVYIYIYIYYTYQITQDMNRSRYRGVLHTYILSIILPSLSLQKRELCFYFIFQYSYHIRARQWHGTSVTYTSIRFIHEFGSRRQRKWRRFKIVIELHKTVCSWTRSLSWLRFSIFSTTPRVLSCGTERRVVHWK
jgi:hypothetical protein